MNEIYTVDIGQIKELLRQAARAKTANWTPYLMVFHRSAKSTARTNGFSSKPTQNEISSGSCADARSGSTPTLWRPALSYQGSTRRC